MANGWKTAQGAEVKHRVLWESLYDQCKKVNVIWRHVKGHAGDPGNEAVDILSKMATDRQKEATTRNVKKNNGKNVDIAKYVSRKGQDIVNNQEPDRRTTGGGGAQKVSHKMF